MFVLSGWQKPKVIVWNKWPKINQRTCLIPLNVIYAWLKNAIDKLLFIERGVEENIEDIIREEKENMELKMKVETDLEDYHQETIFTNIWQDLFSVVDKFGDFKSKS